MHAIMILCPPTFPVATRIESFRSVLFHISSSLGMLGDLNIAEPGALIGFAGPRVIKETIKKDLPEGFQRSEFILEHGFLDFIVPRKELKEKLSTVLSLFKN